MEQRLGFRKWADDPSSMTKPSQPVPSPEFIGRNAGRHQTATPCPAYGSIRAGVGCKNRAWVPKGGFGPQKGPIDQTANISSALARLSPLRLSSRHDRRPGRRWSGPSVDDREAELLVSGMKKARRRVGSDRVPRLWERHSPSRPEATAASSAPNELTRRSYSAVVLRRRLPSSPISDPESWCADSGS